MSAAAALWKLVSSTDLPATAVVVAGGWVIDQCPGHTVLGLIFAKEKKYTK